MAIYPVKLLKDESGSPFVPLTSMSAVIGEELVQTTFTATEVSTGHFIIESDKLTETELKNKIIAVVFPDEVTATTNSYLKLNSNGTEYQIIEANGESPLLVKDYVGAICFVMLKENKWQLIRTSASGSGGGGGHTILDGDGNIMPQQSVLQFKGFGVSDSAGTGATVISTPSLINNLSTSVSGTGPLDAYQGKVLSDKIANCLPLSGGVLSGHLYLNGTGAGVLNTTTQIIFSQNNTLCSNITANVNGDIMLCNSLTDKTVMMGYAPGENAWRPSRDNTTANLGTSAIPWNKVYANSYNGYTLGNASSKTTRSASSVTHSQWNSVSVDSQYVPDMAFIAYWNGAHSSSGSSNLQYCDRGRFGTIVTKGSGDYISTTGGTLSSGSIKKAGNSYSWNTIRDSNETAPLSITSYTGYQPAIKQKTPSGVYGIGCYSNAVHITYFADGTTHNDALHLLQLNYNGNNIYAGGAALPHVWVQSSQPSGKQAGDIWFVT